MELGILKSGGGPIFAAAAHSLESVDLLLAAGASLDETQIHGRTPLFDAVATGDADLVRGLLARGARADVGDQVGWTPLHEAAGRGHGEVVLLLVGARADPNAATTDTRATPLRMAAWSDEFLPALEVLLAVGADPERTDGRERPLAVAAGRGAVGNVRALLARGSPPEGAGRSPLVEAATWGRTEVVRLLLEAGADPDGPSGRVALEVARARGHAEVVALLEAAAGR